MGDLCSSFGISLDAVILNELIGDENKVGEACKGTNGVGVDGSVDDVMGGVDWYGLFTVKVVACCHFLMDVSFGLPRFLCLMSMQLSDLPSVEHRLQGRDTIECH